MTSPFFDGGPYVALLQGIPLESGILLHPFLTSCILRII